VIVSNCHLFPRISDCDKTPSLAWKFGECDAGLFQLYMQCNLTFTKSLVKRFCHVFLRWLVD